MSEQPPHDPNQPYGTPPPVPPASAPQPPQNPYQPYGGAPAYGTSAPAFVPDHPKATTVLILGILGITVCSVCAPFAWVIGGRVKKEIEASGGQLGGRQQAQIGYILGIIGSALMILSVLFVLLYIVVVVIAIGASA